MQNQAFLVFVLLIGYSLAQVSSDGSSFTEILCSVNFPTQPEFCTEIYAPVCASYPRECFTTPCPQVQDFPSNCAACQDANVQSYRPGVCVFTCNPNDTLSNSIDPSFNPVCANYQEECNNSTCRKSFRNSNAACHDPSVVTYTNGVCEGDNLEDNEESILFPGEEESFEGGFEEGVIQDEETILVEDEEESSLNNLFVALLCTDPRPESCAQQYDPVCIFECADTDCRRTAPNACSACTDLNALVYTPQSCEAERIQCAIPDLSAGDIACSDIWDPVCAYSRACEGGSCGITSSNDCNACNIQHADYYIRGECPGTATSN